jgi:hypothetical protein
MTKLHEILAAEKTVVSNTTAILAETLTKFGKEHYFNGQIKSLKMLEETPANLKLEEAARVDEPVKTTVRETLDYALGIFVNGEKLQLQKNATNRKAGANVEFRGRTLLTDLPVDQLLGLEARLVKVRELFLAMPTLDASKPWIADPNLGLFVAPSENTVKTEKTMTYLIAAPATDKHPAQVKEVTKDNVVGMFSIARRSGAATAVQKAEAIQTIDELIVAVKQARMRANEAEVDVAFANQMQGLFDVLMAPFKEQS